MATDTVSPSVHSIEEGLKPVFKDIGVEGSGAHETMKFILESIEDCPEMTTYDIETMAMSYHSGFLEGMKAR